MGALVFKFLETGIVSYLGAVCICRCFIKWRNKTCCVKAFSIRRCYIKHHVKFIQYLHHLEKNVPGEERYGQEAQALSP